MKRAAVKTAVGRPSLKSDGLVAAICARLETGEPLAAICRDDDMPDAATVWRWKESDDQVSQAIARAREEGFDAIANRALEIADTTTDDPQCRKVRIDTRLKLLAKWDPKRYGDKLGLVGGDGQGPVSLAVDVAFVTPAKPA